VSNPRGIKVLIAGGGTGGHLFPALAIGETIMSEMPNATVHFVGSKFGIEATTLPQRNLPHSLLPVRGIQRGLDGRSIGRNLLFPGRLIVAYLKAKSIIKQLDPDIVVGTGGYASGLPLLAAVKSKIPTLIQEQNSYPGLVTRKMASKVDAVCLAFPEAKKYLESDSIFITGNPVRKDIETGSAADGAQFFKLAEKRTTILVFGGSQGSAAINKVIAILIPALNTAGIQLIWQTGPTQYNHFDHFNSATIRVVPFIDEMPAAYALSQIVVCRAGALTLAELALCGKPAILIPLPSAAANHQMWNAQTMADKGAAKVLSESNLTGESLTALLLKLTSDNQLLKEMSGQAAKLAKPDATEKIVNLISKMAQA